MEAATILGNEQLQEMEAASAEASSLLKALANERRLLILCQLVEGEKSVGVLADALGLPQAIVSQQLAILRKEGLVDNRRVAQTIYYRMEHEVAKGVLGILHEHYCKSA